MAINNWRFDAWWSRHGIALRTPNTRPDPGEALPRRSPSLASLADNLIHRTRQARWGLMQCFRRACPGSEQQVAATSLASRSALAARDVRVPVCCPRIARMHANKKAWRKSSTMIGRLFASIRAISGQTRTMSAQTRAYGNRSQSFLPGAIQCA